MRNDDKLLLVSRSSWAVRLLTGRETEFGEAFAARPDSASETVSRVKKSIQRESPGGGPLSYQVEERRIRITDVKITTRVGSVLLRLYPVTFTFGGSTHGLARFHGDGLTPLHLQVNAPSTT
jgi:hypothetical protein